MLGEEILYIVLKRQTTPSGQVKSGMLGVCVWVRISSQALDLLICMPFYLCIYQGKIPSEDSWEYQDSAEHALWIRGYKEIKEKV